MSTAVNRSTPRRLVPGLAVAATVTAAGLSAVPAASAKPVSPLSPIKMHVHHADVALHAVVKAAAKGKVTIPLSLLNSQLSIAANLSADLAVDADTPKLESIAASALNLVAGEEAKVKDLLTAELSTLPKVEVNAVLRADLAATQGEELALSDITHLQIEAKGVVARLKVKISGLANTATSLLTNLLGQLLPSSIGCPSVGGSGQINVSGKPVDVQSLLNPVGLSIPVVGDILDAGTSLVSGLVSQEVAHAKVQLQAQAGCQTADGSDANTSGNGDAGSTGAGVSASVGLSLGLGL
jgi:hypothetical protein